ADAWVARGAVGAEIGVYLLAGGVEPRLAQHSIRPIDGASVTVWSTWSTMPGDCLLLKTLDFRASLVPADWQRGRIEIAAAAGDNSALQPGGAAGDGHRAVGDHSAGSVGDGTADVACRHLGAGAEGQKKQKSALPVE